MKPLGGWCGPFHTSFRGDAVIVDAVRTPLGARNGSLSGWHPSDLGAELLVALARRNRLDPVLVDEVIVGCATPMGDQGLNLGRNAVLAAGWPEAVAATTLDRQGASSLQAVALAAAGVVAGIFDVAVAAGIEVPTTTPPGAWVTPGSRPFGPALVRRYTAAGGLVPPGVAAERVAERYGLSRGVLDRHAAESQRRAAAARDQGRFAAEIVAVAARGWDRQRRQVVDAGCPADADECIFNGSIEEGEQELARCKPTFEPRGRVTAANSAPAADGAAALLITSEHRAAELGWRPLARIVGAGGGGVDPRTMLTAVIPATTAALRRCRLGVDEMACFEVDEWFAPMALAWVAAHHVDPGRVNVNGGSIALGHPPGAAGARALTTVVHHLDRSGAGLALVAAGGIGGVATAMVVEAAG